MMNAKALKNALALLVLGVLVLVGCTSDREPTPSPSATPTQQKDDRKIDGAGEETMPIVVTVQVSPDVALALHQQTPSDKSEELLELLKDLDVTLKPMHPGARDPLLTPFFTVEVPDQATAERVIAGLGESEAVEGVYIKPAEALP
jgi:hypothetical protein